MEPRRRLLDVSIPVQVHGVKKEEIQMQLASGGTVSLLCFAQFIDPLNIRLVNWHLNIVGKVGAMVEEMQAGASTKARE